MSIYEKIFSEASIEFKIDCKLASDELNMSIDEYIEFLCEEQFGIDAEEAYNRNLIF